MSRLEYFIVSESIAIDASTNRVSFFHVLEQVNPGSFPHQIARACAVATLIDDGNDRGELTATVIVTGPDSPPVRADDIRFSFESERVRLIFEFPLLTISERGQVVFELLVNDEHKASHEVMVRHASELEEPTPPSGQD